MNFVYKIDKCPHVATSRRNEMRTNATRCHIWTYSIHVGMIWHAWYGKICVKMFDGPLEPFSLSTHIWIDAIYHKDFYEWGTDDIGVVLLHGQVFSCFSYFFLTKYNKMDISYPDVALLIPIWYRFCSSEVVVCIHVCVPFSGDHFLLPQTMHRLFM